MRLEQLQLLFIGAKTTAIKKIWQIKHLNHEINISWSQFTVLQTKVVVLGLNSYIWRHV